MKSLKKAVTLLLVLVMMFSCIPIRTAQASETVGEIGSENPTVVSLNCENLEVIKGTNGYYTEGFVGDELVYYYRYTDIYPTFSVTFSDGTSYNNQTGGVDHNGEWYRLEVLTEQGPENQWDIGEYTATAILGDATTDFTVDIVKSPIVNMTVDKLEIVEKTNGNYMSGYNSETNEQQEYYYYNNLYPTFSVLLSDGTTLSGQQHGITYQGRYYSFNTSTDQDIANQWGVGEHLATGKLMGYEIDFVVNIMETPVKSIQIDDIDVIEHTGGNWDYGYNSETQEFESYYRYNYKFTNGKVTFKDGSEKQILENYFVYKNQYYNIDLSSHQDATNQWGLGVHNVIARCAGVETNYNMNIIKNPYKDIEVISVVPIKENEREWDYSYGIPDFSYQLVKEDGTRITEFYQRLAHSDAIEVTHQQEEEPWTIGGDNYFTVTYAGSLTAQGKAEIVEADPYDYYEKDGEIIFTGFNKYVDELIIPTEIGGKPVVALESLGCSHLKKVVLPDTIKTIAPQALWAGSLETLVVGSGVAYLDAEMIENCWDIKNIVVSENNPYYCSVDGVVYDKSMETLVMYPRGKGSEFTVPASVKNIDFMFSWEYEDITFNFEEGSETFVEEDDVIYNKDKTKVLYCRPSKVGKYVMPDSVVEIERSAFAYCSQLTGVSIPEGVTEIVYATFYGCTALKEVQLPNTVVSIGRLAFSGCSQLENIVLPSSLEEIGTEAFCGSHLKEIVIPDKVKTIGGSAFENTKLAKATIGSGVKTIGAEAFSRTPIKELTIPDTVTSIEESAFESCDKLEKVVLGEGISVVRKEAFTFCESLKEVVFKNKQVTIEDYAFCDCPIEIINMENVVSFGERAFCSVEIKSLTIKDGVTGVAYAAFENSTNLAEIDVPESLIKICGYAFNNTAWYNAQEDGEVYLEHIFYRYKGEPSKNFVVDMKEGTTTIADYAFEKQSAMTQVMLPDGLLAIGQYAFYGCKGLTELILPASVRYIEQYAFVGCENLGAIHVDPDNPYYKSINGALFNKDGTELVWCPQQENDTYVVPDKVDTIRSGAFDSCKNIKIEIENNNIKLEDYAIGYNLGLRYGISYSSATIACYENSNAYKYAKNNLVLIEVLKPKAVAIAIAKLPDKTQYKCGQLLDASGLKLEVTYSDGSTGIVDNGFEVGAFDSRLPGQKEIAVFYQGCEVAFAVEVTCDGTVVVGSTKGKAGDLVEVTLSFKNALNIKGIAISDLNYDTSKLELVGGKWNLDGILSDWGNISANEGVLAFVQNTLVGENFFTFTFRIKENVEDCKIDINCTTTVKALDGDDEVELVVVTLPGAVEVINVIRGDVDGNGKVTTDDAIYLLYHTMLPNKYPLNQDGDFDGNGKVTTDDAIYLLYHTMLPNKYPLL